MLVGPVVDVGSDVDAKIRVVERGSLGLDIRDVIAAVRHEMKFVEQRGREDPGVLQIEKVVIRPADTGITGYGGGIERVVVIGLIETKGRGNLVLGVEVEIELAGQFVAIIIVRDRGGNRGRSECLRLSHSLPIPECTSGLRGLSS